MNAAVPASATHTRHWLSFRIGTQLYAAPLDDVSEVIRDGDLTPVPGAAPDLLGVRHLRGRIVPVMDGRRRLGLAEAPAANPVMVRVVMLSQAGQRVGLRVDAVGELLCSDGIEIAPPPPGRASRDDDPVSGVLAWQGGFVALLDVRRLCRAEDGGGHVA
ncbi:MULTISPECIES: chemotaxis protein CheW [Rhodanobacter]|uniref:Chemotaxis signal transduction protein n=1 Tax=Rhodanobacter denitrificans TaxID=666685 RepID=M4NGN1_9GAMM|nr:MULTISPECIES: chemotaxis protein CheW [Rhodanobacter]AGG90049.1 chemotaxis signal transduction protein [Rhodanobacter denitrificans]UJJ57652.1 chemotaxis protein CheW [Rhodanobacter denitrificans]UJM85440.1 chemotaxis protein CheW [Rhodanobacter denitrificans]